MFLDEKKFANYHCDQFRHRSEDGKADPRIETLSIGEMREKLDWIIKNCRDNNQDPYETPVFIAATSLRGNNYHCVRKASIGCGDNGLEVVFNIVVGGKHSDRLYYVAPDSKPEEGEYWESRGVSDGHDVSGFVVSKKAGERLLNMVRIVLDEQKPKSRLDYRETEPNWIQFKFDPEEFDLHKLDEMSREARGVITFDILGACVIKKEEE